MGLLHESRLDNTVDAGSIGIGEVVDVCTRMGQPVASGEVVASNPFGIVLKEGGYFSKEYHLFTPIEESPPMEIVNSLNDSPDNRVALKLKEMGLDDAVTEADKLNGKEADAVEKKDGEDSEGSDAGGLGDEDDDDPQKDIPKDDEKKPLAAPKTSVDVNKLPEDIKKAIVSTTQMDGDQLNGVLSEIGDATVKALKRVNVRDTEIYGAAAKVQNAVHRILTGNPPAPPAPPKKKKPSKK